MYIYSSQACLRNNKSIEKNPTFVIIQTTIIPQGNVIKLTENSLYMPF